MSPKPFSPDLDLDDNGQTNGLPAERAADAAELYRLSVHSPDPLNNEHIQDTICDLCHLLHRDGYDVMDVVTSALTCWLEENGDDELTVTLNIS